MSENSTIGVTVKKRSKRILPKRKKKTNHPVLWVVGLAIILLGWAAYVNRAPIARGTRNLFPDYDDEQATQVTGSHERGTTPSAPKIPETD